MQFDIQIEFIEPVKILLEDFHKFADEGIGCDRETDHAVSYRIMMLKEYVGKLEKALTT